MNRYEAERYSAYEAKEAEAKHYERERLRRRELDQRSIPPSQRSAHPSQWPSAAERISETPNPVAKPFKRPQDDVFTLLTRRVDKALALHAKVDDPRPGKDSYCAHCSSEYPCITVQALTEL